MHFILVLIITLKFKISTQSASCIAIIKQQKVRKQVASYLAKRLLATHSTHSIDYYLCLLMQTQFQLGSYIHACTNELANLQDLMPTLAGINIRSTNQLK